MSRKWNPRISICFWESLLVFDVNWCRWMRSSRVYFFEKNLFSFRTYPKSKIDLVGKSSFWLTGTNKKKSRCGKIAERWSRVCQRATSEWRNFQITKKIPEENSTKPTSICPWLSVVLRLFFEQIICWKLNIKELSRKLRFLVGFYKRLSDGGLLKKVIYMDFPCNNKIFWGIKVLKVNNTVLFPWEKITKAVSYKF